MVIVEPERRTGLPPTPVLTAGTERDGAAETTVPGVGPESAVERFELPERLSYRAKRMLLGPPLTTEKLHEEKLSKKAALGVLSSDCISSAAYGTEEMLIVLLGAFGLAGFHILLPMTLVVLLVLFVMTLSYREVVMVYTKAGGSYVVARENFGPRVAQIASVALLIDYVVTVAVQAAAGTAAVTSLVPALNSGEVPLFLTIVVVLILAFGNLRGVREAAKAFAAPTYLFVGAIGLVVVVGVARKFLGDLPVLPTVTGPSTDPNVMIPIHDMGHQILSGVAIFYLLRAFANGGSSLTGLEAISNGVSAFAKPRDRNARRTLSVMSLLLGTLVAGVSYLSYETHATPYNGGSPTVISQVAHAAFGDGAIGHIGFAVVQIATALILFTGANTPFTGFPFLASFLAEDSFLPRQLTRRGHRLAFSNGIVTLTSLALALLIAVGSHVDKLVPFYAIGVFTGFTMAGFGMAKYHRTKREKGWKRKLVVNFTGGAMSLLVVLIFAVTKFTEGAWLVVLLFPLAWLLLIRLNRQYRREASALNLLTQSKRLPSHQASYARHVVIVLVDRLDLAVWRGLRYAQSLRPSTLRAVHFSLDNLVAAELEREWVMDKIGERVPLQIVDCADRRLVRSAGELALNSVILDRAEVTVLLPRRTFRGFSQRLLHDRTADRLAAALGRIPHVAATIVPFDTTLDTVTEERLQRVIAESAACASLPGGSGNESVLRMPAPAEGVLPIGAAHVKESVTVQGRVRSVKLGTAAGQSLEVELFDGSGGLRLLFMGRTAIAGITPGTCLRAHGRVGEFGGHLALANPSYELLV